jgi:hypothetical protein
MNMQQLKQDRKALEERIREVKTELRSTWTKPMGAVQAEHIRLKKEATELCILRAWLRGKLHLDDAEHCKEVAERRMVEYQAEAA